MCFSYSLSDECLRTKLRVTENQSFPFLHFCCIYIYIYVYIYTYINIYIYIYIYSRNAEKVSVIFMYIYIYFSKWRLKKALRDRTRHWLDQNVH